MTTVSPTAIDRQLADLLATRPPTPDRTRFQPLRLGLMGIWEYEDQEFYFHDGRLILRGRNGSGKTKVLEVTSPFLFDADLTARRLDPFGTSARSMRDNLLFRDRTHQIGYVWCEYGRIGENGVPEYRTIGAGLRAQQARRGAPESWYFVTSMRPGLDFTFLGAGRNPNNQVRLTEVLGPDSVFSSATSYRAGVAHELFGTSADRFRSLVELLIALRRPKLSENFGIDKLTSMLTAALPPVDNDLVDELARGFDELADDQEELARIVAARTAIDEFTSVYRVYARRVVRLAAGHVRSSVTGYDDVTRRKTAAARQLAEATALRADLLERSSALELRVTEQNGRIRALEQRPEIEQHAVLLQLERQAKAAERAAVRAAEQLAESTAERDRILDELRSAEGRLAELDLELEHVRARAGGLAERAGLRLEHELETERIWTDTTAASRVLAAVVAARRGAVSQVRRLVAVVDKAQAAVEKAQAARDDAVARREQVAADVLQHRSALAAQIEVVSRTLLSWIEECREIRVDIPGTERLLDLVQSAGEPGSADLGTALFELATGPERAIVGDQATMTGAINRAAVELESVEDEYQVVLAEQDQPPPAPSVDRRDREDVLAGAPLWRLVDFADDVSDEHRAGLEAALLGAGLLDAWVTPDGSVLDQDTLDVVVRPVEPIDGRSLAAALTAADGGPVPPPVLRQVLDGIGLADGEADEPSGTWVSVRGSWSIGPLRGRTAGTVASYIGAPARAAARARRLSALTDRRAAVQAELAELTDRRGELDRRLVRLEDERRAAPDDRSVRNARSRLDAALGQAARAESEVTEADRRWTARSDEAKTAARDLGEFARQHAIDPAEQALIGLEQALAEYRDAVTELATTVRLVLSARTAAGAAGWRRRTGPSTTPGTSWTEPESRKCCANSKPPSGS
jgi:uncharacterized protein (TIGR02680 family)